MEAVESRLLKTCDGKTHEVEKVFVDGVGRQAGLRKTDKGYQVVTDCHGLSPAKVKKQAESIQSVVRPDGTVWFSALCAEMLPVAAALTPDLPPIED